MLTGQDDKDRSECGWRQETLDDSIDRLGSRDTLAFAFCLLGVRGERVTSREFAQKRCPRNSLTQRADVAEQTNECHFGIEGSVFCRYPRRGHQPAKVQATRSPIVIAHESAYLILA